jgi:hypothetical protein
MTLPASGPISNSDINVEIGQASTFSSSLQFLNNQIVPAQRPGTPAMNNFYNLNWFQNNTQGNCSNGNCTSNCNCGNIQCNNCLISGTVNCTNCDAQNWLQTNCNCACTYNCTTSQTSYNCNCACNCSKIICTKLFEIGMMPYSIFAADQQYGEWLKKHDRVVYRGYIKWARIVTSWIDGSGPDFMIWIHNKEKRAEAQKLAATKWAYKIATPWSEHMAYLMGAVKNDNIMGRIIMKIGRPICKIVYFMPKKNILPDTFSTWTMWALFFFSYYTSLNIVKVMNLFDKIKKTKLFSIFKES